MNRIFCKSILVPLTATIILMVAVPTFAQVNLSWSPGDTVTVVQGASTRIFIHLDEVINFRTIEVTVTYDTSLVKSLGGGPGALFSDSGLNIYQDFEEQPGRWHGFAIIMDGGHYLTGPGEVLFWDIEGLVEGVSPGVSVEALLYDEASPPNKIPDVVLDNVTIIVQDPLSSVQDFPHGRERLQLAPNPFNPRTRISFDVMQDTPARLSVFDMRGHQLAILHDGHAPVGTLAVDWNGTDDRGRMQPGGVYLFQLETNSGTARAKGILVK
jgi:hypothetical protein